MKFWRPKKDIEPPSGLPEVNSAEDWPPGIVDAISDLSTSLERALNVLAGVKGEIDEEKT